MKKFFLFAIAVISFQIVSAQMDLPASAEIQGQRSPKKWASLILRSVIPGLM